MERIKEFLTKMFSEESEISSMRIMSFLSLFVGSIIAIVGIYKGSNLSELSVLTAVFVGSAFGGKATQKFAEIIESKETK